MSDCIHTALYGDSQSLLFSTIMSLYTSVQQGWMECHTWTFYCRNHKHQEFIQWIFLQSVCFRAVSWEENPIVSEMLNKAVSLQVWREMLQTDFSLLFSQSWWCQKTILLRQTTEQVKCSFFLSFLSVWQTFKRLWWQSFLCGLWWWEEVSEGCGWVGGRQRGRWGADWAIWRGAVRNHRNLGWKMLQLSKSTQPRQVYDGNQKFDPINNCFTAHFISLLTKGSALSRLESARLWVKAASWY